MLSHSLIDTLLKEGMALQHSGVRALILYPMNALVNDQIKRLRAILCHQPGTDALIKFGFYTSRTGHKAQEAVAQLLMNWQPTATRNFCN